MSGLLIAGLVAAGLLAASRKKKTPAEEAQQAKEAIQEQQTKSSVMRSDDGLLRFTLAGTTRILTSIGQYHVISEQMHEGVGSVLRVVSSPRNESQPLVKVLDQVEEADPKAGLFALVSAQAGDVGIVPGTTFVVIATLAGLQHYNAQGFPILIEPGGKAAFTHDVPGFQPPAPPPPGAPFPAPPGPGVPYQPPAPPYQPPAPPYQPPAPPAPPYQPPAPPAPPGPGVPYQPPAPPAPPYQPPAPPYQPPAPPYQPPAPPYQPPAPPYQPPAPPYQPPAPPAPPYQPPAPPPQPPQEQGGDEDEDVPDAIAALPEPIREKVMEVLSAEPEASPGEMEAVAKLLDKAGHKKAAAEVRKISKERIIIQQFDGTLLTIRDGWNPSYLAKYYTGDPSRWKDLISANHPKMKVNEKGWLVPFNAGDTVKVPLSWNAASKKPPPPVYGTTGKPGVFDAIFGRKQPAPPSKQGGLGVIESINKGAKEVQKWISPS